MTLKLAAAVAGISAGLVLSAGVLTLPGEAKAGRGGHFSLHLPGFSLHIDKNRYYRPYYRNHNYGRHYQRPYYDRPYYEKRHHYDSHGHYQPYDDNQGGE